MFREGPVILGIDLDMNAIEFFNDVTDVKWRKIFQATFPIDLRFHNNLELFQRFSYGA